MSEQPNSETLETSDALRLVIGRLARRLRQQSLGGLTPSQRSVLSSLDRHGGMTMSQLADHERISRPSASGIVGRLVEKGLLRQEQDQDDGRARFVLPTPEGSELVVRGRHERTAFLARELAGLTDAEFSTVARATEILTAMLDGEA